MPACADCRLRRVNNFLDVFLPFPKRQILDSSKLKELADDNFEFKENGRKFSKWVENTVEKEKLLVTSNFSFSHCVFKRLVLQTRKNQGLFGKWLKAPFERAWLMVHVDY